MIRSRKRETIWIGLDGDDPDSWGVHSEDDMVMIETAHGEDEIEILISPALFPQIKKVIEGLERRFAP